MNRLKHDLRRWLPPALLERIRPAPSLPARIWATGPFASWQAAQGTGLGYADPAILERVWQAVQQVHSGQGAQESDGFVLQQPYISWPVLSSLLWLASRGEPLRVLDFGGSLGSSFFQLWPFLAQLPNLYWAVVELPQFVELGQRELATPHLGFFASLEEATLAAKPNAVLLSGSLNYLASPAALISQIQQLLPDLVILDRVAIAAEPRNYILRQHVELATHREIYPFHVFPEAWLLEQWLPTHRLVSRFDTRDGFAVPVATRWNGYILSRRQP